MRKISITEMSRFQKRAVGFCLIIVMLFTINAPVTGSANSSPEDDTVLVRLNTLSISPAIGMVASFNPFSINGRTLQTSAAIRDGDLLQSATDESAQINIDGIGVAVLAKASIARLSWTASLNNNRPVLIASLVRGEIAVQLNSEQSIYLEAGGKLFTVSPGAKLRASITTAGYTLIDTASGNVQLAQSQSSRTYIIRPIELGALSSVRARSTRQVQVQVTDEHDKPVPDLPVLFALGSGKFGSLGSSATTSFSAVTDAKGVAGVTFNAGTTPGTESITATVEGSNAIWSGEITVIKAVGFWTTRNTLLVTAAAVAAGTATGIVVSNSGGSKSQIVAQPPVIKR